MSAEVAEPTASAQPAEAEEPAPSDYNAVLAQAKEVAPELLSLSGKVVSAQELFDGNQRFLSETQTDEYCGLYAEILKMRNEGTEGGQTAETEQIRSDMNKIYRSINHLFGLVAGGGTYFGHEHARLVARTEYTVYRYLHDKKLRDGFAEPVSMTEKEASDFEALFWTVATQWRINLGDGAEYWIVELGYQGLCDRMFEIKTELNALESDLENKFYYDCALDYINHLMLTLIGQTEE